MDKEFALEVLPEENDLEVDAVVDDGFTVMDDNEDIYRPGESNDIIRDRRQ